MIIARWPLLAGLPAALLIHGSPAARQPPSTVKVPFRAGETFVYGAKWEFVGAGTVTLKVEAVDTMRGVAVWRFSLTNRIAALFYHDSSVLTSWTTVDSLVSLRFRHNIDGTGFSRHDDFAIFPDSGWYRNARDSTTGRTVAQPLDDLAFIYYLRTVPLLPDSSYRFQRYFRQDRNPVRVHVVNREPCHVPAERATPCLQLGIVVDDPPHGMFMASQNARLWLTDDARRIPVRIKSGHATLTLRSEAP